MGGVRCALLDELIDYDEAAAELRRREARLTQLDRRVQDGPSGDELMDVRELWPLMSSEERRSLVSSTLENVVLTWICATSSA